MKKYLLVILAICFTCFTAAAEGRSTITGNWMLQEIEDQNGNRTTIEYGDNILIFDDLLHMGCINSLKKIRKFTICQLSDYSTFALDTKHMKLFLSGKAFFDGDDIKKKLRYDIVLLNEETLVLEYNGTKAIYYRMDE